MPKKKERKKEKKRNSRNVHCTLTTANVNVDVQNIFHGRNNITCSTACKYRAAATLYAPKTWFHIRNLNTPHKGDNKDDDHDDDDNNNNNNNNNNNI